MSPTHVADLMSIHIGVLCLSLPLRVATAEALFPLADSTGVDCGASETSDWNLGVGADGIEPPTAGV